MKRFFTIFVLLALTGGSVFAAPKRQKSLDPAEVNDLSLPAPQSNVAKGPAILRAQILLDRANFSVGQIDGIKGRNYERALGGFQESRGLPVSKKIDAETWKALNSDTAPALVPYRVTAADVAGPFEKIPQDMLEKGKLKVLGYETPLEALAEEFHSSPALLQMLNRDKDFSKADEEILVPNVTTNFSAKAASIVVSKEENTVTALDKTGKIIAQYPCSSGSEHDPLPIGDWKINGVARNPPFHYNPALFWDATSNHTKAKIAPGPNNPVGVVWIDLSKEHYGIHGTPEPSRVGYTQSHGCIRLTNWDATELAGLVSPGTPAKLTE